MISSNLVSVVVPCYNQGSYLAEALESVLAQSFINWECIIVDDGSSDTTASVAQEWIKKDSRIKYIYQENRGLASARNTGIKYSQGAYILPLDADDLIAGTYIERGVEVLGDKSIKIVYCEAEYFGARKGKWEIPDFSIEGLAHHNLIFCSALFRKEDFFSAGGYNTNMKYGWEDWDFWIALLKDGGGVYRIPETSFYYRVKENSMITAMNEKRKQKMYMQIYLNHSDFFDRYHEEPIELLDKYQALNYNLSSLAKYNIELEKEIRLLKGIIKMKPTAYFNLFRKYFKF